jgi:hypothetical protein
MADDEIPKYGIMVVNLKFGALNYMVVMMPSPQMKGRMDSMGYFTGYTAADKRRKAYSYTVRQKRTAARIQNKEIDRRKYT